MTLRVFWVALVIGLGTSQAQQPSELLQEVQDLKSAGQYQAAVKKLREALDHDPIDSVTSNVLRLHLKTLLTIASLPTVLQDSLSQVARSYEKAETLLFEEENEEAARELLLRAYRLRRTLLGQLNLDTASAAEHLGELLGYFGEANGITFLSEALSTHQQLLGSSHPEVGEDWEKLGEVYIELQLEAQADSCLENAYATYQDSHMDPCFSCAGVDQARAGLANQRGEYGIAKAFLKRALQVVEEAQDPDVEQMSFILNDLASTLTALGSYDQARDIFQDLTQQEDTDLNHAAAYINLADTYAKERRHDESITQYKNAMKILQAKADGNIDLTDLLGTCAHGLALQYTNIGKYDEAERLLALAKRSWEDFYEPTDHIFAKWTLSSARNLREQKRYRESRVLYERALSQFDSTHADYGRFLYSYGNLLDDLGEFELAEKILNRAVQSFEAFRHKIQDDVSRAEFQDSPYPRLANTLLEQGKEQEAWNAIEKYQARELGAILELDQANADGIEPLEAIQSRLDIHEAIIGWLDLEVSTNQYASWTYIIRKEAPIQWIRTHDGPGPAFSASSMDTLATQQNPKIISRGIKPALQPGQDVQANSPFDHANTLQRMLRDNFSAKSLAPFLKYFSNRFTMAEDMLEGVERLYVVPSGAMLSIPIEVLEDKHGINLCDRFEISYTPYAGLIQQRSTQDSSLHLDRAFFIGDPPFSIQQRDEMHAEYGVHVVSRRPLMPPNRQGTTGPHEGITRLRGTRSEVSRIAHLFRSTRAYLGIEATEELMIRLAQSGELAGFDVLHFATHATVSLDHPGRSALVFSQVDLPDPLEQLQHGEPIIDGLVSVDEILERWQLSAELVTLSACEIVIDSQAGGERHIGLARALLRVGARNVLISLWPVDDEPTALLMEYFYEDLLSAHPSGNISTSLRKAKRQLKSLESYNNPYFWAGFVLVSAGK